MKYLILSFFFLFSFGQSFAEESNRKLPTGHYNTTPKTVSHPSNEELYESMINEIISDLEKLPKICKRRGPSYRKVIQFQTALNNIKTKTINAKTAKRQYGFLFGHSLDRMFAINIFFEYVYNGRFQYNFEIPKKKSELKEYLEDLSEDFELIYRAGFKDELTPIEDFPIWARYIAQTLKCLAK